MSCSQVTHYLYSPAQLFLPTAELFLQLLTHSHMRRQSSRNRMRRVSGNTHFEMTNHYC